MDNTSKIGLFKIVSESSVAAGVRRIEARTGAQILELLRGATQTIHQAAAELKLSNPADLVARCAAISAELKQKNHELAVLETKLASIQFGKFIENAKEVKGVKVVSAMLSDIKADVMRTMGDQVKEKWPDAVAILVSMGEKSQMLCVCGKEAVARGAHAGKIVKEISAMTGGKGGGRPDNAMAGIGDNTKIDEALLSLPKLLEKML